MIQINRLARSLRIVFGVSRILVLLSGVSLLVLSLLSPRQTSRSWLPLRYVSVLLPAEAGPENKSATTYGTFSLGRLTTDLLLNPRSSDPSLNRVIRSTVLPFYLVEFIIAWISLGLLRALCLRAEDGEIFSDRNLASIRNIGLLQLSAVGCECVFQVLTRTLLIPRLGPLSSDVLNAQLQYPWLPPSFLPDLIAGLVVLLIAEAFRQGLALQKENELTV